MTPRRRALIIVGLLLMLMSIILFAVFLLPKVVPSAQPTVPVVEVTPRDEFETPPPEVDFVNPLILTAPASPGRTAGQQMAELFAERFGSYSNLGDYQNLRDLLPVMTASMRAKTEKYLATADTTPGQPFEGVSSERVSTIVRSLDTDSAVIAVSLQQERTSGSTITTGYRTLRMELRKIGDDWRIDAAAWEN